MPPMTLASKSSMAGLDGGGSSLEGSNFRLPGRGVWGHKAHRAREEEVGLAMESL